MQYQTPEHVNAVIDDMLENWQRLSQGKNIMPFCHQFHSRSANYYRLIKARNSGLKLTALFDPNILNDGLGSDKEAWIAEILADYNAQFDTSFGYASYAKFKTDLSGQVVAYQCV